MLLTVQVKVVSTCSGKPMCAPPRLSYKFSQFRLRNSPSVWPDGRQPFLVPFSEDPGVLPRPVSPPDERLCPQVVSQALQHFRSSEMRAAFGGCFARQSIYPATCLVTPSRGVGNGCRDLGPASGMHEELSHRPGIAVVFCEHPFSVSASSLFALA